MNILECEAKIESQMAKIRASLAQQLFWSRLQNTYLVGQFAGIAAMTTSVIYSPVFLSGFAIYMMGFIGFWFAALRLKTIDARVNRELDTARRLVETYKMPIDITE